MSIIVIIMIIIIMIIIIIIIIIIKIIVNVYMAYFNTLIPFSSEKHTKQTGF